MFEIDGGIGEGGGQILRTSLALSAMMLKPIRIFNIRKNRPNPGLRPQHMTSVKILAELTNATVNGLVEGSTELIFHPKQKVAVNKVYDIGTAGSISLLIQAITPFCMTLNKPIIFEFIGGTNVRWSPPIEYLQFVTIPLLKKMNVNFQIELVKRGFYPKGGGRVKVIFYPTIKISPLVLSVNQKIKKIEGFSYASNLPEHVINRQANAAIKMIKESGIIVDNLNIQIKMEKPQTSPSPGSGILIYSILEEGGIIGSDSLGEKGIPAENIGKKAATNLINQIKIGAAIDKNMGDMLIPYLAFADGKSVICISELTDHTITNIKIVEKMANIKFKIKENRNEPVIIEVQGLGIKEYLH